jgi:hypothetical protein
MSDKANILAENPIAKTAAGILVLGASGLSIIMIGGKPGVVAFFVISVAAIMWRTQPARRPDAILRLSLSTGSVALLGGVALLLWAATSQRGEKSSEIPEINAAVISGSYYPFAFKTPFHPSGVVVLEALTADGAAYLPDSAAMAGLTTAVGASRAESLMQSFRLANAKPGVVEQVRRPFATQIVLDSVSASLYLTKPSNSDVPHDVAALSHGKQRLGVLGLSAPGKDSTGTVAVIFARIRLPVTDTEPLLERASLLLLRKGASAWTIANYWELAKKP